MIGTGYRTSQEYRKLQIKAVIFYIKDEFKIEPRYAHKKKLKQIREKIHILEMDHLRPLKFE